MPEPPPYAKVVVGFEPNERGEDARALGSLLGRTAAGSVSEVHIEHGPAGRGLQELAERGEADLIVLGSTHRAGIGSVAPGSVAEHLLSGAPCRIAIAPRGYARARAVLHAELSGEAADDVPAGEPLPMVRPELRLVAVGYDGRPESRAALVDAERIAGRGPAAVRLVGVTTPETRDLETVLAETAAALPAELRALPVHERGDPAVRLLEHSGQGVDLLVLGSRGHGPLLRALTGSVSAKLIRRAACPVLVVPRPGGRGKAP